MDNKTKFEAWARKACDMPDHAAINYDAPWTQAALEGWNGAMAEVVAASTQGSQTSLSGISADQVQQAREALDNLDDYARMDTGVDAIGPRGVLETFISNVEKAAKGS
jgi:hypothetical protein